MTESQHRCEEIFELYHPKIMRYISSRIYNRQEVEDLAQNVFVKILSSIDTYDETRASLSTWVYTVTQNTVRDYLRRCKTAKEHTGGAENLEIIPFDDVEANGDALVSEEQLEALAQALEKLSERERDIVIYFYYKGYSHKMIAEQMSISYANTRYICHQAVNKLREVMKTTA